MEAGCGRDCAVVLRWVDVVRNAEGYRFWSDESTQDPKEWRRFGQRVRDRQHLGPGAVGGDLAGARARANGQKATRWQTANRAALYACFQQSPAPCCCIWKAQRRQYRPELLCTGSELVMGAEHRSAALFPHTSCPRQQPSRARQEPRPAQTHDGHGQWESALLARQQLFTAS